MRAAVQSSVYHVASSKENNTAQKVPTTGVALDETKVTVGVLHETVTNQWFK